MQTESAAFTAAALPHFFEEILVWDVKRTAERLRNAGARLHQLATRIADDSAPSSDGWNAKEVLAHIAVLSRAYGVFGYMVATGRLTALPPGDGINKRSGRGDTDS